LEEVLTERSLCWKGLISAYSSLLEALLENIFVQNLLEILKKASKSFLHKKLC
jgi:hypothetical protein